MAASQAAGGDDRCALVTGAARGIGAAIARTLAGEGWVVGVNFSADQAGAASVVEEISAAGGRAVPVRADVADPDAVGEMFDVLERDCGPVLTIVNNAGMRHDRLVGGLAREHWQRVLDVNLSGAYHTIHRGMGPMVRHRFGRIVNVSSISATRPLPGQACYAASKAGVEALTKTVATEVARRGVTANAIAPGLVDTGFVPEMTDAWASIVPARRTADPLEIANCVRFLVSEEAAYVNGCVMTVDGALTAGLGVFTPRRPPAAPTRSASQGGGE